MAAKRTTKSPAKKRTKAQRAPAPEAAQRWEQAAARLGLDAAARDAGTILLLAELDEGARNALMDAQATAVAPRRTDLLKALSEDHSADAALAGLVALESRGAATPLGQYAGPWANAELETDARVRAFCTGAVAPSLVTRPQGFRPSPRLARQLDACVEICSSEAARCLVIVRGGAGSGRDTILRALLAELGVAMLAKTALELRAHSDALEPELSGSAAVWDARRTDPSPEDYELARRWLRRSPTVAVAVLDRHQDSPELGERLALELDAEPANADERKHCWEVALVEHVTDPSTRVRAAELLSHRNGAGAGLATRATALLDGAHDEVSSVIAAVERQLNLALQPSALRGVIVEAPSVPLHRVIASDSVTTALERLLSLCEAAPHLETPERRGVKALFTGPTGTGKTLAARAVTSTLGRRLYRVDLAAVVSKWVGETEKNLRRALATAATAGAVLLFDEGDALFGKRGEVSKGTDRYANIEVAYLLQAIEAFDGIVIVTSNLRSNIDEAFERRFDVTIDFTPPERTLRERIWRQELGSAGEGIPAQFIARVARHADIHGGHIASAARMAKVLAYREGRAAVTERDVADAVHAEFLKLGSTVQAANWMKVVGAG